MTSSPASSARYAVLDVGAANAQNNHVWPQVEHMGADYRWDDRDSATAVTENRPLSAAPNLNSFHLNDATEITDLISQAYIGATGLLASEAFRDVLSSHIVQTYQAYPAQVVHRGRSFRYDWLHFTAQVEDRIAYTDSRFVLRRYDRTKEPVSIADRNALRREAARLANTMSGDLSSDTLTFLPGAPRYDLFFLDLPSATFYISSPLADSLARRGLTGFEIGPKDTEVVFQSVREAGAQGG